MNTNEVEYDGLFYKIDSEAKTATLSRSNGSNPVFRQAQVLFDFKIPSVMYYNDEQYTITGIADRAFMECHVGWLVLGAYIGMCLDECVRAVFMFLRWHKGIWKNKNLLDE